MAAASRSRSDRSLDLRCAASARVKMSARQGVEQLDRIVERRGLQRLEQGGEGGRAPRLVQRRQVGRLGDARTARQSSERGGRQVGAWRQAQAVASDGIDALQMPQQLRRRAPLRRRPQVVQRGERVVIGGDQRHELLPLLVGQGAASGDAKAARSRDGARG